MSKQLFQDIKDFKFQIQILKTQIPSIKNQLMLDNHVKLINSMITMVNNIEAVMNKEYSTDVIDKLLVALLYERVKRFEYTPFNWKQEVLKVDAVVKDPIVYQYQYLSRFFISHEQNAILNNTSSDTTLQQYKDVPTASKYVDLTKDLLIQLKSSIVWN